MTTYTYNAGCNDSSLDIDGEIEANNKDEAYQLIENEFLENCGFYININ